ncbi:hypothetical protein [Methylophaga sp. OBS4]|uniref:hypothetical protein n=1 Tax=Methylophaga sp. OBS4 TaxID=2991935 RepID=UPI002256796C|nr:hypothetical protein [Methylophaga sp. OBS4]MCX4186738.1 hypothetical protein [Methylophaga sp. OBS4]
MSISSNQLWPQIRDAFGISPDLKVKDFQLSLAADSAAQINMEILADCDPASPELKTIRSKFNLGESGIPKEQAEAAYWSGVNDGFQAGKDPDWMHTSHIIAFNAKKQLQDMANKFRQEKLGLPPTKPNDPWLMDGYPISRPGDVKSAAGGMERSYKQKLAEPAGRYRGTGQ